jgi:hypothetical protein
MDEHAELRCAKRSGAFFLSAFAIAKLGKTDTAAAANPLTRNCLRFKILARIFLKVICLEISRFRGEHRINGSAEKRGLAHYGRLKELIYSSDESLIHMEHFLHRSPPLSVRAVFQGHLHRIHDGPPLLRFGIRSHFGHVQCIVFAIVFEIAEKDTIA